MAKLKGFLIRDSLSSPYITVIPTSYTPKNVSATTFNGEIKIPPNGHYTEFFPYINKVGDYQYFSNGSYVKAVADFTSTVYNHPSWGLQLEGFNNKGVSVWRYLYLIKKIDNVSVKCVVTMDKLNGAEYPKDCYLGTSSSSPKTICSIMYLLSNYKSGYFKAIGGSTSAFDNGLYFARTFGENTNLFITDLLNSAIDTYVGSDEGETSIPNGQDGDYSNDSDTITDDLTTDTDGNITNVSNIISSGFARMYKMSSTQLLDLANYLYSAPTEFIEHLKKLGINPMESIVNLGAINYNANGVDSNIIICGRNTNVNGNRLNYQYVQLNCGSIDINKYFGNSLDYSPYTKVEIYLPFIGSVNLNCDDIMGKSINVKYNIDLLNGSCVAKIYVNDSVLYTFSGNCMSQIPLTSADSKNIYASVISLIGTTATAIASGGASIPLTGVVASGLSVMGSKENVSRGGSCVSSNGNLNVKKPYVTITRPIQSLPQNFHKFKGYVSNITKTLSELNGYTEITYIHLDDIECTNSEKEMLESILKNGIIL